MGDIKTLSDAAWVDGNPVSKANVRAFGDKVDEAVHDLSDEIANLLDDIAAAGLPNFGEGISDDERPGEAPRIFTADKTGFLEATTPLEPSVAAASSFGRVVRIEGAGVVAPRKLQGMEPGQRYRVRAAVRRHVNSDDPLNDAVRFGLQWLTASGTSNGETVISDMGLLVSDGLVLSTATIALDAGDGVDHVAPSNTVYVRPFIQTYGAPPPATDIVVISARLFADGVAGDVDVIAAQEARAGAESARDASLGYRNESEVFRNESLLARDAATLASNVFDDTAAGLAGTTEGDFFSVPGSGGLFMILYRHDSGPTATEIVRYPQYADTDEVLLGTHAERVVSPARLSDRIAPLEEVPFRVSEYGPKFFINDLTIGGSSTGVTVADDLFTIADGGSMVVSSTGGILLIPAGSNLVAWFEVVEGAFAAVPSGWSRLGKFVFRKFTDISSFSATFANGSGAPIVITRMAYQFLTGRDVMPDHQAWAMPSYLASIKNNVANIWNFATTDMGKAAGAGDPPSRQVDGSVLVPADCSAFMRNNVTYNPGDDLTWFVRIRGPNIQIRAVFVRYVGVDPGNQTSFRLHNLGEGWWGARHQIPIDFTTPTQYMRVEIDNRNLHLYTSDDVVLDYTEAYETGEFPSARPLGGGGGGASGYSKNEIVVQQSSGQILAFVPGGNPTTSEYIRYQLIEYSGAQAGGEGWDWRQITPATRVGDDSFIMHSIMNDAGAHWPALREYDQLFIGNSVHGHEIDDSHTFFIDGIKRPIDGSTSYRCRRAEFIKRSTLFSRVDAGTTPIFNLFLAMEFAAEYVTLRTQFRALTNVTVATAYTAMLSFNKHLGGNEANDEVVDTWYAAPRYIEDFTGTEGSPLTSNRLIMTGSVSKLSGEVEMIAGWDNPNRRSFIQITGGSRKHYFSPIGINLDPGLAMVTNDTIETVARYRISNAN